MARRPVSPESTPAAPPRVRLEAVPLLRWPAAADDTATDVPADAKREWAADNNIIRLHDAKHGTHLQNSTPVVCQTCHYTPALDLAHLGPLGPGDADANGRDQKIHTTNSRVMHAFHGQFTDLFSNDLPPPSDPRRINDATGKPVVNAFVKDKLNNSCYQCHPGPEYQVPARGHVQRRDGL